MRRALRMLGRACIWAAAFNIFVVLYALSVEPLVPDVETMGQGGKYLLVTGLGIWAVIAHDIAEVILPPFYDTEF